MYPIEHDPICIDWTRCTTGAGLRVLAYTDEEGRPYIGAVWLNERGEIYGRPEYQQGSAWRTTAIFDGKLLKFWAVASPEGLQMFYKQIPAHNWQGEGRAVAWTSAIPAVSF